MTSPPTTPAQRGLPGPVYAVGAYATWGLFPLYWKLLLHVPPLQILAHRILWSMVFVGGLLLWQRRWRELVLALRSRRTLLTMCGSTVLIGINWYLYIWAVNSGHVLETSLGYFINPLVNVLLGMAFLKERLRPWQWVSVLLAAVGVLNLALSSGQPPWISLALAASFGTYGLLRKIAQVESLVGLAVETALLSIPAGMLCVWWEVDGVAAFGHGDARSNGLLVFAGVVTALPLLWFADAAKRMPLSTLGFFQYLAPTGQFLLAILLYKETFTATHTVTFACIWSALAIYAVGGVWAAHVEARLRRANGVA